MKIVHSPKADILYIEFSSKPVVRSKIVSNMVNITFDVDGAPVSLEVVSAALRGMDITNFDINLAPDETPVAESPISQKVAE